MLKNLEDASTRVSQVVIDIGTFSRSLAQGDGTIRRLVMDPGLYNSLNEAAATASKSVIRLDRILCDFALFADSRTITTSVDGNGTFSIRFRATQNGALSQLLSAGSRITPAEAYNAAGERFDVAFRFNGANGTVVAGAGFELMQNTPNPVSATQGRSRSTSRTRWLPSTESPRWARPTVPDTIVTRNPMARRAHASSPFIS